MKQRFLFIVFVAILAGVICVGVRRFGVGTSIESNLPVRLVQKETPVKKPRGGTFPSGFVGTQACATCHADRHQSYLNTHHSRSLREVDLDDEIPDSSFVHELSKSVFQVAKQDGRLWHRHWRYLGDDPESERILAGDYPIRYVMGSGAFAKGYLAEEGKYLVQAPLAWYRGSNGYDMSPGYDAIKHQGFTRLVSDVCLFCHAGSLSRQDGNPNLYTIHELAIGCERCHGPGAAHSDYYRDVANGTIQADPSDPRAAITHPGKLVRRRNESICAQCHAQGDITVLWNRKKIWDFVPGDDFAATAMKFSGVVKGEPGNAFVGHFAQMRASACYQKSETLTCTSCHDPHASTSPVSSDQLHRDQCASCHTDDSCGVALPQRMQANQNHCVACHMPTIPTEVPHTATTNHRIAIYGDSSPVNAVQLEANAVELKSIQDPPEDAADHELERMTAVATADWLLNTPKGAKWFAKMAPSVGKRMDSLIERGHGDSGLYKSLAMLTKSHNDTIPDTPETKNIKTGLWIWAGQYAEAARKREPDPTFTRGFALEVIGRKHLYLGEFVEAATVFEELTTMRRSVFDWFSLGVARAQNNQPEKAEQALRTAIKVDPVDPSAYQALGILLAERDPAESKRLSDLAAKLSK